jgi:hypothetical protein
METWFPLCASLRNISRFTHSDYLRTCVMLRTVHAFDQQTQQRNATMDLSPICLEALESRAAERARWAAVLAPSARAPRRIVRRSLIARLFGL